MDTAKEAEALKNYFEAVKRLRSENILTNQKDFTCQIGEWLVEKIYHGERAVSGIQKGWDVKADHGYIQVKAHAKAEGNNNKWSAVENETSVRIDELIIIVFSPEYKLLKFYKAPWDEAKVFIKQRGKKKLRSEINWSKLEKYRQRIDQLPRQDIISLFK